MGEFAAEPLFRIGGRAELVPRDSPGKARLQRSDFDLNRAAFIITTLQEAMSASVRPAVASETPLRLPCGSPLAVFARNLTRRQRDCRGQHPAPTSA